MNINPPVLFNIFEIDWDKRLRYFINNYINVAPYFSFLSNNRDKWDLSKRDMR